MINSHFLIEKFFRIYREQFSIKFDPPEFFDHRSKNSPRVYSMYNRAYKNETWTESIVKFLNLNGPSGSILLSGKIPRSTITTRQELYLRRAIPDPSFLVHLLDRPAFWHRPYSLHVSNRFQQTFFPRAEFHGFVERHPRKFRWQVFIVLLLSNF